MYCKRCGCDIKRGSRYCGKCGTLILDLSAYLDDRVLEGGMLPIRKYVREKKLCLYVSIAALLVVVLYFVFFA